MKKFTKSLEAEVLDEIASRIEINLLKPLSKKDRGLYEKFIVLLWILSDEGYAIKRVR